jgi:beta-glucosidase-like glycosyl hydrolase
VYVCVSSRDKGKPAYQSSHRMCSYNLVNSSWACQNSKAINGLLKHELGFQGQVMRYVQSSALISSHTLPLMLIVASG